MVNELSQYDTSITFEEKWVRKYWTLITMEYIKTKHIHYYATDLNNWSNKKPIQWTKFKV